jgi:hypothetical protein
MQSPPFVALVLAGLFRLMGLQNIQETYWIDHVYSASKSE